MFIISILLRNISLFVPNSDFPCGGNVCRGGGGLFGMRWVVEVMGLSPLLP